MCFIKCKSIERLWIGGKSPLKFTQDDVISVDGEGVKQAIRLKTKPLQLFMKRFGVRLSYLFKYCSNICEMGNE